MGIHRIDNYPSDSHDEGSQSDQGVEPLTARQIFRREAKNILDEPNNQQEHNGHLQQQAPQQQNTQQLPAPQQQNALHSQQLAAPQQTNYQYQQPISQQAALMDPQQLAPQQKIKPLPIDPAFRAGKSGRQLEILLDEIYKQKSTVGGLRLGINKLGTRYAIFGFEFVFFEDPQFEDRIVSYAVTQLGMADLSSTAIKNLMKVLRGNDFYWAQDDERTHSPCVRVVNQGFPNIGYFFSPLQGVVMSLQNPEWRSGCVGVLAPTGAKHAPYNARYFDNTEVADDARSGSMKVPNLVSIFDSIGIKNEHRPLLASWMIHSLVARDYYLLEIASQSESVSKNVCKAIKEIIDPCDPSLYKIPLKPMTIARHGLDHYLLNFYSDKALSEVQQEALLDLMTGDGIKVDGIKQRLDKAQCFVKRPVMLCANNSETVINHQKLRSRTINIKLDVSSDNPSNISTHQLDSARTELIRLAKVCSESIYNKHDHNNSLGLPESIYSQQANMDDISSLLVVLAKSFGKDHNEYLRCFNGWQVENLFLELDDNDAAFLIYLWAEDHLNKEHEFSESGSIKEWKERLSSYAESEGIVDWDTKSHRLIGEEFRSSNLVLNKLGIRVESAGRGSRLSNWTITLPTKISIESIHLK